MPKLVLSLDGVALKDVPIAKDRTTIGRRSHNDLVIDNLAVSGEHAVMVRSGDEYFLRSTCSTAATSSTSASIGCASSPTAAKPRRVRRSTSTLRSR